MKNILIIFGVIVIVGIVYIVYTKKSVSSSQSVIDQAKAAADALAKSIRDNKIRGNVFKKANTAATGRATPVPYNPLTDAYYNEKISLLNSDSAFYSYYKTDMYNFYKSQGLYGGAIIQNSDFEIKYIGT